MVENSLPWGGVAVGDAGPYTDDQWSDVWRKLFTRDRTLEGVFPDYLNELIVTNPAGATIRVGTGGAVVDGKMYDNSAVVDLAGAVPGGGSNFYTVVLDKDFAAQTVRAALLGPNVVAPPAVTQADGVTWEIAIYTVEITSGAVVTLTDVRAYCHYNMEISGAMLPNDVITTPKILNGAVTAVKMTDGAGSGVDADLLDGLEGVAYTNTLATLSATGDIILNAVATLIPGMSTNLSTGTYMITATAVFIVQGASGQFANINLQCHLDGVLQNGEAHDEDDIDASGRDRLVTLSYCWRLVVTGVQTYQVRASVTAGFTAVTTTRWQITKAQILKV